MDVYTNIYILPISSMRTAAFSLFTGILMFLLGSWAVAQGVDPATIGVLAVLAFWIIERKARPFNAA